MGRDICEVEGERRWSVQAARVRGGATGGALVGLGWVLLFGSRAHAFDPKDGLCEPGEDCIPIVINDPKTYDAATEEAYAKSAVTAWPNWPFPDTASPQAVEGVSSIFAPGGSSPEGLRIGTLVAANVGDTWFEDWFLYEPTHHMNGLGQSWQFERSDHSSADEVLADYESLGNSSYGHMAVKFKYKDPLSDSDLASLPDLPSVYVTETHEYSVFIEIAGAMTKAGALYRERWNYYGEIQWRDTWVLWDNFTFTIDTNSGRLNRPLQLVPAPSISWSRKAFLYAQRGGPQNWHVSTTGVFTPID